MLMRSSACAAGRWVNRRVEYENASLTVRLALVRTAGYYLYNLVVPLLVLVSIQLGTMFVPANAQDKPALLLGVVVPFFFYQVRMRQSSAHTARWSAGQYCT